MTFNLLTPFVVSQRTQDCFHIDFVQILYHKLSFKMKEVVFASIESFAALLAVELGTSFVFSALQPSRAVAPLLRLIALLVISAAVYGRRFRPNGDGSRAWRSGMNALAGNLRIRLDGATVCLLAFHGFQALASFWLHGSGSSQLDFAVAGRCLSLSAWLWSPAIEELLSRYVLFYVAFQRSGGNLLFSVLVGAFIFGLMHLWNVASQGLSLLTILQVVLGVVAGSTYGAVFARTGSITAAWLLHAANNVVAFVWMALEGQSVAAGEAGEGGDAGELCKPRFSTAMLVLLCAQLAVYSGVCAATLKAILHGAAASPAAAADFKRAHPLIYDPDEPQAAAAPAIAAAPAAAPAPAAAIADAPAATATGVNSGVAANGTGGGEVRRR